MNDRLEIGGTLEALRRKNLEGKKSFVEELRRQKTPQAISLLLEILCDESWYLRDLAIGALVEVGPTVIEPLRRLLATGLWYTRAAAARALAGLGDAGSAPIFLQLIEESNLSVRDAGVTALKELAAVGRSSAIREALAALPPEVRSSRTALLNQLAPDLVRVSSDTTSHVSDAPSGGFSSGSSSPGTDSPRTSDDRHAAGDRSRPGGFPAGA